MKFLSQKQNQTYGLKSILERRYEIISGQKKEPKPEQTSSAKIVLMGQDLVRFWKIHAAIMCVLYAVWILLGFRNNDYEFVITARSSNDMWLNILCTQALVWVHVCNTLSAIIYLFILNRKMRDIPVSSSTMDLLQKCRKSIILVIFSSLTFYTIMTCYREHNDLGTLNICPVVIFILFSHLSSLIFKMDFHKKMKVLKERLLSSPKEG